MKDVHIEKELITAKSAAKIFELFKSKQYCIFLDSALNTNDLGRYSIIAFDPFMVFKSKGRVINIITNGYSRKMIGDPLDYLKSLLKKYRYDIKSDLPFISGGIGYFSYDLCSQLESIKDNRKDRLHVPDIMFCFYNNAIIVDHIKNKAYIVVSSIGTDNSCSLKKKLDQISAIISVDDSIIASPSVRARQNLRRVPSNFSKEKYCNMVERAKEYIRNGDIYQVNLSQRFSTAINPSDCFRLYSRLRIANPAPFSAYLDFGDVKVLSSSPERFIKIRKGIIETRPIKGTRPRGKSVEEDNMLFNELIRSEKDRAELTMIVDLERNDLGRVCRIGSVHVKKLFEVEKYATVQHLVSTIEGTLLPGIDVIDCIRAAFPGGSITGAPKIRAMEIINELEPVKRGIYTGSIGYIGFDGSCDLNIAIRTIIVKGSEVFYNVGGGIVWDSLPEKEYQETLDKGKALMQVLMEGE